MSAHPSRANTAWTAAKLLIWAVIAAALVRIAFFPTTSQAEEPDPSASYGPMTVLASTGTITNTLSLSGTIRADDPTTVKATQEGTVTAVYVQDGANVEIGDSIVLIQQEIPQDPIETTDADGNITMTEVASTWENTWINAQTAGAVTLQVMEGQMVGIGDAVATIQPPTYSAVASLSAEQMYRLQSVPSEATITITDGPAAFTCLGLTVSAGSGSGDGAAVEGGDGSATSTMEARCQIPTDKTVFPGLEATISITAGQAEDAVLVPVTTVEGRYQQGAVWLVTGDPEDATKTDVELGLTDGTYIQITAGIAAGDEILQFVPDSEDAGGTGATPASGSGG